MPAVSFADVCAAADRIRRFVSRTPVHTSGTMDRLSHRELFFKCENFQTTGSFKYRGATNAVQKLDAATASRGVVTHSSGNHAQALALAAKVRGIPATIVMPRTAPAVKKQAVLGYGGRVIECEPTIADRLRVVSEVERETGAVLIPPYDHPDVIAGQGTAALELLADVPALDAVVVPVGGGGMLSGYCVAIQGANPTVRVFGAEPLNADDAARSLATGERQPQVPPNSIADGLLTNLGELTWPIIQKHVEGIFTVSEAEIVAAMRLVWERMKLVIEPSAAVGVAVVLGEAFKATNARRVGVVLCGGNVGLDRLYW
ncbi:MAG: pyridoxal-phosphate dependent enzyme [Fimbriiglobus sp.]|jgi:threonine dehydratase/serine racemase|nr:pyridoxal-phosphate dependent enzyme [Fimbriiglobus sp.]